MPFFKETNCALVSSGSKIKRTRSALEICFFERRMPFFSIGLAVFLIPAVSISVTGVPRREKESSTVSLVVPGELSIIEREVPDSAFRMVDFPTFGFPQITTLAPSDIIL